MSNIITDTSLISAMLRSNTSITNEEIIRDLISKDVISEDKQLMYYGVEYYNSKNTEILNREFTYMKDGRPIKDEYRSNNKLPNGFLKTLIDQKVDYCISKPVIVENVDNVKKLFNVNKFVRKICKESSKKGVEWAHPYIDKKGNFKIINISGQEIIPIYDTSFENELLQIIRYYTIYIVDDDGNETKRYKVEWWDNEKVTYYMQDSRGYYYFDTEIETNPAYHWMEFSIQLGEVKEKIGHGWGKVPFVPLWNNDEHDNDLQPIKAHIDLYDKILSDFANNLEDIQDSIMKVINYSGMSDKPDEFLEYLKKYKVVFVDENGNVEFLKIDIPVEAKKEMLSILRDSIFDFGQGVDVNKVGDGNITNVVIKNRYAGIDLKANGIEANIKEFLAELFWFSNKYLGITGQKQDDLDKMDITFNRSIIINTKETIEGVVSSKGIISNRTAISNHPWVNNVDDELKEIELDNENNKLMLNLDDDTDNEDTNIDDNKQV